MNTLRQNRLLMNQLPHFITRSVDHFLFLVFFGKKLYLISFFVHYIVIQLIDFYWNYFLYNFSLLDGLLRLVFCWWYIATSSWPLTSEQWECYLATFYDESYSSAKIFILLHMERQSVAYFEHLFFFFRLFFTYQPNFFLLWSLNLL